MEVKEIERIVHNAVVVDVNGEKYSVQNLIPVSDKTQIKTLELSTLTGLKDYIDCGLDNIEKAKMYIVAESFSSVDLFLSADKKTKLRQSPVRVALDTNGKNFAYGQFMGVGDFLIKLNSMFVETAELANLVKYVSKLVVNNSITTEDDGISQTSTLKKGVSSALVEAKTAPAKIELSPMRTFVEIEQPKSLFLFRMKTDSQGTPSCALFEADGGAWKLNAMQSIKKWLVENIKDVPVIA